MRRCMDNARKKHSFFAVFSGCYPSNFAEHNNARESLWVIYLDLSCISAECAMLTGAEYILF